MKRKEFIQKLRYLVRPLKWFYPGMRVKRWMLFSFIGIMLIVSGGQFLSHPTAMFRIVGIIIILIGIIVVLMGMWRMAASLVGVFMPQREKEFVDIVYEKRHLSRGHRMVAIGGGTGLSTLLLGLKKYTSNITAVVTVTDEGGSSGKLRHDFGILPPGDIRNCLVALADTEKLMMNLFQYRFKGSSDLKGHSFGNLFLLAMTKVTRNFEEAVKESSKILAIRGQVVPATLEKVRLLAELEDGTKELGEVKVSASPKPIKKLSLIPHNCNATNGALDAIRNAEAIILGPGSLYTSVIPNLLINEITEAIKASKAPKIYTCNVMTQHGETDNYKASDHIDALLQVTGIGSIDYAIVNTGEVPRKLLDRYEKENAYPVAPDAEEIRAKGITVIEDNVINAYDYVRHNSVRLAKVIIDVVSIAKTEAAHAE